MKRLTITLSNGEKVALAPMTVNRAKGQDRRYRFTVDGDNCWQVIHWAKGGWAVLNPYRTLKAMHDRLGGALNATLVK